MRCRRRRASELGVRVTDSLEAVVDMDSVVRQHFRPPVGLNRTVGSASVFIS
jgi:hypothetical protein